MITTGVTGQPWRASISPWGAVEPWDERPLNWYVAADDRWHVPADETTVRQHRIEGTPVTETRVRVPNGDVVQRIYSVADAGGLTIVEIENESTMAVAVAFDRSDVLTERPIASVPIEGIDLPDGSFVLPLAHTAVVRVALAHSAARTDALAASNTTPMQVVRGWQTLTERASRFVLPDGERGATLAERVTAERCEIALGTLSTAEADPAGYALALGELVRMGEQPEHWVPELVDSVAALGPVATWDADVGLDAAQRVLLAADERRALRDLRRIVEHRSPAARPATPPDGVRAVAWLESLLAHDGTILPGGLPDEWLGQSVEVYGVPTSTGSSVSFALRWHGERPAVLWEQSGDAVELTSPTLAPGWASTEAKGETLWPAPPGSAQSTAPSTAGMSPQPPSDDPGSFS